MNHTQPQRLGQSGFVLVWGWQSDTELGVIIGVIILPIFIKAECSYLALSGSYCLRSTLAAAPVLFAHAVITVANKRTMLSTLL